MTTIQVPVIPELVGGSRCGDIWIDKISGLASVPVISDASARVGWLTNKLGSVYYCYALRFDIDIPAGSTINGVMLNWTLDNYYVAPGVWSSPMRMYWLKQDTTWPHALAFSGYPDIGSIPLAYRWGSFSGPVVVDLSKAQGGVVFDHTLDGTVLSIGNEYKWGDGLTEDEEFSGLAANLNQFLIDNESSRGTDGAGGIACCLVVDRQETGPEQSLFFRTADYAGTDFDPILTIDYTPPLGLGVSARDSLGLSVSSKSKLGLSVTARSSILGSVSGKQEVKASVSKRTTLEPAVSGKGN